MKDKISKLISVLKKDGIIETSKKTCRYIKSRYISKINLFAYLNIKLNMKKFNKIMDDIIDSNDYDRIIIWRSTFGWNVPLMQRPQHISKNLANQKCLVFYEITTMTDKVKNIKKMFPNLYLVNFNNKAMKDLLLKKLNTVDKPKYIQFYSTDCSVSLEELKGYISNGYKVIYEYIDDLSPVIVGTKELPKNLIDKYNYMLNDKENVFVVVTADEIEKDVVSKRGNEKLAYSCNGVDIEHFRDVNEDYVFEEEFNKLIKSNKPIIGYYGAMAMWFDYDLIKKLAVARKDYNIVLIGIKYDDSLEKANLGEYDNIYYLGCKDYDILQNYANKFNVCTIPFVINSITNATSPVKLFEYMALEKPIVTTAMHECKKYQSVMVANNEQEFIDFVDEAVKMTKDNNEAYYMLLRKEAEENKWDKKASIIIDLIKSYEK